MPNLTPCAEDLIKGLILDARAACVESCKAHGYAQIAAARADMFTGCLIAVLDEMHFEGNGPAALALLGQTATILRRENGHIYADPRILN